MEELERWMYCRNGKGEADTVARLSVMRVAGSAACLAAFVRNGRRAAYGSSCCKLSKAACQ